jgi:hypothetical protein
VASAQGGEVTIAIARASGDEAVIQQIHGLAATLEDIAAALEAPTPDATRIQRLYQSLLGTWMPGVITSIVGNVLTALTILR